MRARAFDGGARPIEGGRRPACSSSAFRLEIGRPHRLALPLAWLRNAVAGHRLARVTPRLASTCAPPGVFSSLTAAMRTLLLASP